MNVFGRHPLRSHCGLDSATLCFSWPWIGRTVDKEDILVTLNTGESFHPSGVSSSPSSERNEKHCLLILIDIGNRIVPNGSNDCVRRADANESSNSCAFYPVKFEVVGDLFFAGPPKDAKASDGPWEQGSAVVKNGKGLLHLFDGWTDDPSPYLVGPSLIGAHLSRYTEAGEVGYSDSKDNSATAMYQIPEFSDPVYRLRVFFTGSVTPNGLTSVAPTDYEKYWLLLATDQRTNSSVGISQTGVPYDTNGPHVEVCLSGFVCPQARHLSGAAPRHTLSPQPPAGARLPPALHFLELHVASPCVYREAL